MTRWNPICGTDPVKRPRRLPDRPFGRHPPAFTTRYEARRTGASKVRHFTPLFQEIQRSLLVARPGDETFQHLVLVIHRPPKVMHLTVGPHKHLVEVPLPVAGVRALDPSILDLGRDHRAEPMPPKPDGLVANVNAALVEQTPTLQSESEANAEHRSQAEDLGAGLEVPDWTGFRHAPTQTGNLPRLKPSSFDRSPSSSFMTAGERRSTHGKVPKA